MAGSGNAPGGILTTVRAPARPRPGQPSLLVVVDGEAATFPIPDVGELVIGRAPECDVRVDHPSVSRRHAILRSGARLSIEDLGSANGTRVRDALLTPGAPAEIAPGEVLDVGSAVLVVQRGARDAARPAPARAMDELDRLVGLVAPSRITVLVLGETGAGKEVLARAIHRRSPRARGPMVPLHCAALPEPLLEGELFGYERGAFTGALQPKPGLIETATGGTLFLDEVGDLPPATQAKLLRVLEDRKVTRLGAVTPREVDVRFIAATHKDLDAEVAAGRFREDLLFRLRGITLTVPPLRERPDDLDRLVDEIAAEILERDPARITGDARAILRAHRWPGNVRELRNVIERAAVLAAGGPIGPDHIRLDTAAAAGAPAAGAPAPVDTDERSRILDALQRCGGNQTRAAALLGVSRRTLTNWLGKYDIPRPLKDRT